MPGDPATLVYMDGMTPSKLLKAVSKGHVIVARYITMEVYFLFENNLVASVTIR